MKEFINKYIFSFLDRGIQLNSICFLILLTNNIQASIIVGTLGAFIYRTYQKNKHG